jgi:hypothetical protein
VKAWVIPQADAESRVAHESTHEKRRYGKLKDEAAQGIVQS